MGSVGRRALVFVVAGRAAAHVPLGHLRVRPRGQTTKPDPPSASRHPAADKSKIAQLVFGGFTKCLYQVQKFDSDTERVLSVILDAESLKWFKPGRGQFQILYRWGSDQREYQPDFVAETADTIYMMEPKARNDMEDGEVLEKKAAAIKWCRNATDHNAKHGGKPWRYLLIPHDAIAENMTIAGLAAQYEVDPER
jgi:type III restriction enzyme